MGNRFGDLIRHIFGDGIEKAGPCLSEEAFACLIEGKVVAKDRKKAGRHLASCGMCREALEDYQFVSKAVSETGDVRIPNWVLERAKALLSEEAGGNVLEIAARIGQGILELVSTTGEMIVKGQAVPLPVLRGRGIAQSEQDLRVVKSFQDILADVQLEMTQMPGLDMIVRVNNKKTKQRAQGIRVTLTRDDRELESSITVDGKVAFQRLREGIYQILLTKGGEKLGVVLVDLKGRQ